jgi:hypothetical protein
MKTTFIVDLVVEPVEQFRGTVRHVGSGEEIVFSSAEKLLDFMERRGAAGGLKGAAWPPGKSEGGEMKGSARRGCEAAGRRPDSAADGGATGGTGGRPLRG